jgi:bis(5'-nucleosyl)-tetraphosphatase (symmetrical)
MNYLMGDVQGCCDALQRLLSKIDFSASRDHLYVLGDLVNRGPQSLNTLRLLRGLGASATCLLGNHDLSLLATAQGVRKPQKGDTTHDILEAPDREDWLDWLRHRRMAVFEQGWLMVHAGVAPQWDVAQTLLLAAEVETMLKSDALGEFLPLMYGDQPGRWSDALEGAPRLRLIVNVLTRTRLMTADGTLDLLSKEGVEHAPAGLFPWFDLPTRRTTNTPIAFGHWASLGLVDRPGLLALDTGCVWGRQLSAARIDGEQREIIQVSCHLDS